LRPRRALARDQTSETLGELVQIAEHRLTRAHGDRERYVVVRVDVAPSRRVGLGVIAGAEPQSSSAAFAECDSDPNYAGEQRELTQRRTHDRVDVETGSSTALPHEPRLSLKSPILACYARDLQAWTRRSGPVFVEAGGDQRQWGGGG
jgi:hypothetical protein